MAKTVSKRKNVAKPADRPSWLRAAATGVLGLFLAALSMIAAAATAGLLTVPVPGLGGAFYASERVGRSAAERAIEQPEDVSEFAEFRALSLSAMQYDSFSPTGPALAALAERGRDDEDAARALLRRSERLSRRDRLTQYLIMQGDLEKQDVAQALVHFDLILRTLGDPPVEMFRQIVPLIALDEGREAFAPLLKRQPNWLIAFLESATAYSESPDAVVQMIEDAGVALPTGARARSVYASLVTRLIEAGQADALIRIYPKLPDADPAALGRFAPSPLGDLAGYSPAIWGFPEEAELGGNLLASDDGEAAYLRLFAAPGRTGIAATKVFLSAGAREISGRADNLLEDRGAAAHVATSCVGSGEFFSRSPDLMQQGNSRFRLDLPRGCALLRVDVILKGGDGPASIGLDVKDLRAQ